MGMSTPKLHCRLPSLNRAGVQFLQTIKSKVIIEIEVAYVNLTNKRSCVTARLSGDLLHHVA